MGLTAAATSEKDSNYFVSGIAWPLGAGQAQQILTAYTEEKPDIAVGQNGQCLIVYKGQISNNVFYAVLNDFGWFGNFPAFGATKTGLGVVNTDGG